MPDFDQTLTKVILTGLFGKLLFLFVIETMNYNNYIDLWPLRIGAKGLTEIEKNLATC
jgi:hypothetical protein